MLAAYSSGELAIGSPPSAMSRFASFSTGVTGATRQFESEAPSVFSGSLDAAGPASISSWPNLGALDFSRRLLHPISTISEFRQGMQELGNLERAAAWQGGRAILPTRTVDTD
jgi:hypothetical protein